MDTSFPDNLAKELTDYITRYRKVNRRLPNEIEIRVFIKKWLENNNCQIIREKELG